LSRRKKADKRAKAEGKKEEALQEFERFALVLP
jgi:hypothetical protein